MQTASFHIERITVPSMSPLFVTCRIWVMFRTKISNYSACFMSLNLLVLSSPFHQRTAAGIKANTKQRDSLVALITITDARGAR